MTTDPTLLTRRTLLRSGALATGALALGPSFWTRAVATGATPGPGPYGPLGPPDANGLQLPAGFKARLIARGNEVVAGTTYRYPIFPDGQATYGLRSGGWILVTNSETAGPEAGVSAIRFAPDGQIEDAYRILTGTLLNCGGGPTPWGTWLSGEEFDEGGGSAGGSPAGTIPVPAGAGRGAIWECDPTRPSQGVRRPAMGLFKHEAAAVDPLGQRVYLTEDNGDGAFYRFTPDLYPNLDSGVLEVALVGAGGVVQWLRVPNPAATPPAPEPKRQVRAYTEFDRGEGIWFDSGIVYVATTGDGKIHAYDTVANTMTVVYDEKTVKDAPLTDVDNICVSPSGDLFAAEDNGGEDGIDVAILTPELTVSRFVRATGPKHRGEPVSELTGPVFDPSGRRLYVASQRARNAAGVVVGEVYEISGPFRLERPRSGPAAPGLAVTPGATVLPGQAVGSGQGRADGARLVGSALGIEVPRRVRWDVARRRGIPVALTLDEAATVDVRVRGRFRPVKLAERRRRLRRSYTLATARRRAVRGAQSVRVPLGRDAVRLLSGRRTPLRLVVEVTLTDPRGRRDRLTRTLVLGPPQARAQKAASSRATPTGSS
jgi:uncharacterized protein